MGIKWKRESGGIEILPNSFRDHVSKNIITLFNTVILVRIFIKFLDSHFLFIEKVQAFLDII